MECCLSRRSLFPILNPRPPVRPLKQGYGCPFLPLSSPRSLFFSLPSSYLEKRRRNGPLPLPPTAKGEKRRGRKAYFFFTASFSFSSFPLPPPTLAAPTLPPLLHRLSPPPPPPTAPVTAQGDGEHGEGEEEEEGWLERAPTWKGRGEEGKASFFLLYFTPFPPLSSTFSLPPPSLFAISLLLLLATSFFQPATSGKS